MIASREVERRWNDRRARGARRRERVGLRGVDSTGVAVACLVHRGATRVRDLFFCEPHRLCIFQCRKYVPRGGPVRVVRGVRVGEYCVTFQYLLQRESQAQTKSKTVSVRVHRSHT